jgi:hypothetical protein
MWAKVIISHEGKMTWGRVTHVRCGICSEVEKKKNLLVIKFDGLQKNMQVVGKQHLHV